MHPGILEVEELVLHYGTGEGPVKAVDGVSLRIEEKGEVLALIGESGSGKTSLARALMRLLPRNVDRFEGRVRLNGTDLMSLSQDRFRRDILWRRISMVFQGAMSSLNPVLRVGKQVAEPLVKDGMSDRVAIREAESLLEMVGLPTGTVRSFPHELSGGMKQRVVIAMALVHRPGLVILDEPTSALDASVQAQIMNLLKELKWELGLSMLFITHDIALAGDLSDKVAVIHGGELRERGTAEQVLTRPLDPYTQALLASVPRLRSAQRPSFLSGSPPDLIHPPSGCRFHPRCSYAFEPCPTDPPSLSEVESGHLARCWLYAAPYPASRGSLPPVASLQGDKALPPGPQPLSVRAPSPFASLRGTKSYADKSLVQVEDLEVHFHTRRGVFRTETVRAVNGVSLTVGRGEMVAVVGESGSGKTTLGRATLGLVPPSAGRVVFDGMGISRLDGAEARAFRRRAQAVFQDPYASISPFMSVYETVEEPLLVHELGDRREREERVMAALEQVRFSPAARFASSYPHTMSGGQRQRVGIARALVLGPEYVVADEPVSMIDASSRAEILQLLRDLGDEQGIAFLYITHDIATARHFSDRIAVMYAGRIVEAGPSAQLVENPQHPYTQALVAAIPEPEADNRLRLREVVGGEAPDPTSIPTGCAFHPRCPKMIDGTCQEVVPLLVPPPGTHPVACHLYPSSTGGSPSSSVQR